MILAHLCDEPKGLKTNMCMVGCILNDRFFTTFLLPLVLDKVPWSTLILWITLLWISDTFAVSSVSSLSYCKYSYCQIEWWVCGNLISNHSLINAKGFTCSNWKLGEFRGYIWHVVWSNSKSHGKFAAYENFYFCRIPLVDEHCVLLGYCAYTGMLTFFIIPCALRLHLDSHGFQIKGFDNYSMR